MRRACICIANRQCCSEKQQPRPLPRSTLRRPCGTPLDEITEKFRSLA